MLNLNLHKDEITKLRREFHKIPEIAYKEFKTSEKIKEFLKEFGIENVKSCAGTGVTAVIDAGKEKTAALRVDIDALPVTEETGLSYQSETPGMMHACGHDGHIAIGLMTAKLANEFKNKLKFNLKILFQPAEEGAGGALPMIEDGALSEPSVDLILGCHIWPEIERGKIDITKGASFASSDRFKITINGKGGHGAMPEKVKNAIAAGCDIVKEYEEISKKESSRHVLSVCSFEAKSTYNVFPNDCILKGTLRTLDMDFRTRFIKTLTSAAEEIFRKYGVEGKADFIFEYPPLINNPIICEKAINALKDENLISFGPAMAAEDFAYFAERKPAVHIRIGSGDEEFHMPLHNSKFNFKEDVLLDAVRVILKILESDIDA